MRVADEHGKRASVMRESGKVFGVGLGKTGTHSLNTAFEVLGLRSVHYPDPAGMLEGSRRGDFDLVLGGYRAATDVSVAAFFGELDRAYPGSRFVLTHRPIDAWLASQADHRARREHELLDPRCPKALVREQVYGIRHFDASLYAEAYERHADRVRAYFAERPGDLLEVRVCEGEGWDRLCAFLGMDIPGVAFPHRNARRAVEGVTR